MIDSKAIVDLVEQRVDEIIEQQALTKLANLDFEAIAKQCIGSYIHNRISASFSNIMQLPDIEKSIFSATEKLLQKNRLPGIENYIDEATVKRGVDSAVQDLISSTIDNLVLDQDWINKIENLVARRMSDKVSEHISGIDIASVIVNETDRSIERLKDKFFSGFETKGIGDTATHRQLTVMDGIVVVENELVANSSIVEKDLEIKGTATVQNLVVKGVINTDNESWQEISNQAAAQARDLLTDEWRESLVTQVLSLAKEQGIDFDTVNIGGHPLIQKNKINPDIIESNLQKLGTLSSLKVSGQADISNTLMVRDKRVGINTADPEMALGIWDEEVSLIAGKCNKDHAFVGTGRRQSLSLGVNRNPVIEINQEGDVSLKNLRVDRFKIGFAPQVPGWSGTRGDIIFNCDPKPNTPFAWVCLGSFRWQTLGS